MNHWCTVRNAGNNFHQYVVTLRHTMPICTRQLLCARVVYNIGSVVVATRRVGLAIRGVDLFVTVLFSSLLVNSECVQTFSYFF